MYSEKWIEAIEDNNEYVLEKQKKGIPYYSCSYNMLYGVPIPEDIKLSYLVDNLYDFKNLTFGLFQIDLENFFEIKFHMLKQLNCQFSEIEQMPYYELEYMVEKLKKWLEKEKEQRDKEEAEYKEKSNKNSYMKEADGMMNKYGANRSSSSYKQPSRPSMKTPNIGNFKMPK